MTSTTPRLHGADGLEHGKVEREQHARDDEGHEDEEHGLDQGKDLGDGIVELLVVEVGHGAQHVAQGARLLPHLHHLEGQVLHHARRLQGGVRLLPSRMSCVAAEMASAMARLATDDEATSRAFTSGRPPWSRAARVRANWLVA